MPSATYALLKTDVGSMQKIKLTVRSIEAITSGPKDMIYWDSELTGFGLKVTPKGRRSFFVYYRTTDHTQRRPLIGTYPAMRPEQARTIAREWLAEVRAGGDPSASRQRKRALRGDGTVTDLFADYRRAKADLRSLGEITRIFTQDILPSIGKKRAEQVTRSDVSRLLDSLAARSPTVASNARKRLSAFYSWALPRLPDGAVNPVTSAIAAPSPRARERILSEDELSALWEVLDDEREPWRTALRLLILTGQRRGEAFGADWSEFDLASARWTIPDSRTKNSKVHIVPLSPPALLLLGQVDQSGPVFPGSQRSFSYAARRIRRKLDEKLGYEAASWSWHDIRRTVATGLQRLGVRLEVTEAVLNHVSGSRAGIVGVYQRYDWLDEKRAALDAWANTIVGA